MTVNYEEKVDEIRWKLSMIKSTRVSLTLKARAVKQISDLLDDCYYGHYVTNKNVNMFFLCHVDSLYNISYKKFIRGMWDAMLQDETYEVLHHLKKYFNNILNN